MSSTAAILALTFFTQNAGPIPLSKSLVQAQTLARANDWKGARETLQKAVRANPLASGEAWSSLGTAYLNEGNFAAGSDAFLTALKLGGNIPKFKANSAYNAACCDARAGKKDQAFAELQVALDLGFRSLTDLRTDTDLESLHGDPRWEVIAGAKDVSKMSRDEGWRYDLWLLNREARRIHYSPYRITSEETMDQFVANLDRDIPALTDDQVTVRLVEFLALFGDGHTNLTPMNLYAKVFPYQTFLFEEGLYVTAAAPEYKELVGCRIDAIDGKPIADVQTALEKYVSRDNSQWIKRQLPMMLVSGKGLYAAGLLTSPEGETLTVTGEDGKSKQVLVKTAAPVGGGGHRGPQAGSDWIVVRAAGDAAPYMKDMARPFWFEYLPDKKTMYCQFNAVQNGREETLAQFADRLYKAVDDQKAERLVFDVRWNGGGNNTLLRPLIHGIIQRPNLNQTGHLFVISGRQTFSACQNFITRLDKEAKVIFVGEPSGSKPNFVGETVRIDLPYSKLTPSISDMYWADGQAWDSRQWIAPDLYAPPTFSLYKTNRDPSMEAIIGYLSANP